MFDWHNYFTAARPMFNNISRVHRVRGYVRNAYGRRYSVRPGKDYILLNYLIQGGCADMMKEKLVAIDDYLRASNSGAFIVSTIHDEVLIDCPESKLREVAKNVIRIMEDFKTPVKGLRPAFDVVDFTVELKVCNYRWGESEALVL